MQTQINAPLQALLQTAAMVTPKDNTPTVAAQVAQAAQQKMQAQAMPPGIAALMPGVKQQAMMSAQAAQPATQGDVNQLRQMITQAQQAQAPQGQGIAAGADVPMAEGGIVGYASRGYVDPQLPEVYEAYNEPSAGESRTGREEEELFGAVKTARQRAIEEATEELLGPMTRARLAEAPPTPARTPLARPPAAPARTPLARPPAAPTPATVPQQSALENYLQQLTVATQIAQSEALGPLRGMAQKQPATQEELDFVKAQKENIDKSRAQVEAQQKRYDELERQRSEAGKVSKLDDLASFLARAGGAGSLFRGLGQATLGMEPIEAARRKEAQAAIDRRQQYMDALEERKNAIDLRDLEISRGRMDRAKAAQDRIDSANKAISQITAQLQGDQVKGVASLLGHQLVAEESAKGRAASSRQAEEVKFMNLLGRLDQFKQEELRKVEADHVKDPKYRMIYALSSTGAKLTAEQEAQLNVAEADLAMKKRRVLAGIDPRISQIESRLGFAPVGGKTVQKYDAQGNPVK